METKRFADFNLSRLMLGTVQFGLNYGIANTAGQPSKETVREILATAYEAGVNSLDTAAMYGTSEEVLGNVLHELDLSDKMIVVSKVRAIAEDYPSGHEVDQLVESSVVQSLKRLKLETLPICLFHREENFKYIDSLLKLKDKGLVRHVGSSVMTPKATLNILATGLAEAIQLPTNILDHRFISAGVFDLADKNNIAIFVRSIYLQGLVLMADETILPELAEVKPVLQKLRTLAREAGLSIGELAVRYILSLKGQTCTLVGVETVKQMRENIELFNRGPLPADLFMAVAKIVPTLSDHIIMPTKWSKRMPDVKPS
jgi:aryl-alcohol dehydrogenase-like predicted oxidoreductase